MSGIWKEKKTRIHIFKHLDTSFNLSAAFLESYDTLQKTRHKWWRPVYTKNDN